MPQPFAYYFRILTSGEKQSGARMTQVVEAYIGKVCLFEYRLEVPSVEVSDQNRRPGTGGKYQVVVLILIAGLQPLFKLFSPMALKLPIRCAGIGVVLLLCAVFGSLKYHPPTFVVE